jgi:putative Mn2+ efflux pump MntP
MSVMHMVLLSLDSLVAGCALAPLLSRASHRLAAAVLVGSADAAASMLGSLIVVPLGGLPIAASAVIALYGIYLICVTSLAGRGLRVASQLGRSSRAHSAPVPTWVVLVALAVALSIDNLLSAGDAPEFLPVAACSGGLMLVGVAAGGRISRGWSYRARSAWLGAGLVATACLAVLS